MKKFYQDLAKTFTITGLAIVAMFLFYTGIETPIDKPNVELPLSFLLAIIDICIASAWLRKEEDDKSGINKSVSDELNNK